MDDLYHRFLKALNEGRLIEAGGANDILQQILAQKETGKELADELKFTLSSKLMTDVTKVINTYLHAGTNNNNYTYKFFNDAANKLRLFQQIADTNYYNPLDVKVNLLFLDGHANWHSYKTPELMASLAKADSAIALKPQAAYLYNLKGLMLVALRQYDAAKSALKKGIALAPNWLYPYHNLGNAYANQFKYDSAILSYTMALKIDSNYQTTYGGIASIYVDKNDIDAAIYWTQKGLSKDSTDASLWAQLGYEYINQKKWPQAAGAFHNAMQYDPTYLLAIEGALRVHIYDFKSEDSVKYYTTKMIAADSSNPVTYKNLGILFNEFGLYEDAALQLNYSIALDSLNPYTWRAISKTYAGLGNDTASFNTLAMAWMIDSTNVTNNNDLGNYFFAKNNYYGAKYFFKKAIALDPDNAVLLSNYAMAAQYNNDNAEAEEYYKSALRKDKNNGPAYFQLAILYAATKPEEAIKQLEMAAKNGYSKADIEAENALQVLKDHKAFKTLLLRIK